MKSLILYRALKIDAPEDVFLASMGICWTSDWAKAFPYGYKNNIDRYYIYTAKVSPECVDAGKTELMSNGEFSCEREVVLLSGSEIEIIRIETVTIFPPRRKGPGEYIFNKEVESINVNFKTKI